MHITKKILLGSALLPVLFVATLVVSAVTDTTPTAAAAACRVALTVGGIEVSDGSESEKNVSATLTFSHEEAEDGISMLAGWKTDAGHFTSANANLRVPTDSKLKFAPDFTDRTYHEDGYWVYELDTTEGGSWRWTGYRTIPNLYDGADIQMYARAGGDRCRTIVNFDIEPESCSLDDVDISGASSVDLADDSTKTYTASFDYDADSVRYRFLIEDEWTPNGWNRTYGSSGSQSISWDNYGEGTYRVCVQAKPENNGNVCNATKSSCMTVDVTEDEPEAVLQVRSQNPSSGVGMDVVGGTFDGQSFETPEDFRHSGDLRMRVYADPTAPNGNRFAYWEGCGYEDGSGDRACNMKVDQGQTRTVRAVYNEPDGKTTLYVRSSNPSSGVGMDVVGGVFPEQSFETTGTFKRSGDLRMRVYADPTAPGGNKFSHWEGCGYEDGYGDRACNMQVDEGEARTVTAVYEGEDPSVYGCMDPSANNYDPNATQDDGSCTYDPDEPDPDDEAYINVTSVGVANADIDFLRGDQENYLGPYTGYQRIHTTGTSDFPIVVTDNVSDPGWMSAASQIGSKVPTDWDGPCISGGTGRNCKLPDIQVGQTYNFTVYYEEEDQPIAGCTDSDAENYDADAEVDDGSCEYQAEFNNFSAANDPDINFSVSPPEIHIDDQPFELIWSTEHADSVTASGDWSGSKSTSGSEYRTESVSGNVESGDTSYNVLESSDNNGELYIDDETLSNGNIFYHWN